MAATQRIVIENAAIATVDARDTEYASGHVVVADDVIESVGEGRAPEGLTDVVRRIDASGHLVTPGLVNTHHHFYQWITRGLATDHNLFDWLVALYPTWARIDERMTYAAAQGSLGMMARGGVTTAMDHHYVFPKGSGDLSGSIIRAAREMGVRFTLARGSMDRSEKDGGLPPDFAVETLEGALAATEATVDEHHDASFGAMTQIAVAPCSPFSVSTELLREGAQLARRLGVRLHTHGSETVEEEKFCHELFGMGPTDYFESTGWLGEDVWMAHCVHMNDSDIEAFARTRTGWPTVRRPTPGWPRGSPESRTCWRPASRSASASTAPRPTSPANSTPSCATPSSSTASAATAKRRSTPARHCASAPSAVPRSWAGRTRSAPWSRASSPTSSCGSWTPSPTRRSPTR